MATDTATAGLRAAEDLVGALERLVPFGTAQVHLAFALSTMQLLSLVGEWVSGVVADGPDGEREAALALRGRIGWLAYRLGEQTAGAIR